MNATEQRRELSFDGRGINGPDEYRSRIATFTSDEAAQRYGKLFEAAPELLESATELLRVITALGEVNVLGDWPVVREALRPLREAVAKATT